MGLVFEWKRGLIELAITQYFVQNGNMIFY